MMLFFDGNERFFCLAARGHTRRHARRAAQGEVRMRSFSVRSGGLALLVVLLALTGLALLVVGCGTSSTTSSGSPSAVASGSSSTAATWGPSELAAVTTDPSLKAMLPADLQNGITCISDIPYPPWEYFDPPDSTNPAGFDYDLSQALARKIGVPIEFKDSGFDAGILAIISNKFPMMISAMYDNEERQKNGMSFVDYTTDGTGILTLKGNPNGLTGLDSLAGKTVTCERGSTQQAFLENLNQEFQSQGKSQMQLLVVGTQPEALLKVTGKTAVADLTDWSTATNIARTTNDGATFEVVQDPAAPYDPQMNGIGMNSKDTALVDVVQKALQALMDAGQYQQLCAAWGFKPLPEATVNAGPAYAASHALPSASPSP
jgi:polar amino acid transport system substrate-binding protein